MVSAILSLLLPHHPHLIIANLGPLNDLVSSPAHHKLGPTHRLAYTRLVPRLLDIAVFENSTPTINHSDSAQPSPTRPTVLASCDAAHRFATYRLEPTCTRRGRKKADYRSTGPRLYDLLDLCNPKRTPGLLLLHQHLDQLVSVQRYVNNCLLSTFVVLPCIPSHPSPTHPPQSLSVHLKPQDELPSHGDKHTNAYICNLHQFPTLHLLCHVGGHDCDLSHAGTCTRTLASL